jgi:hypothetical protein
MQAKMRLQIKQQCNNTATLVAAFLQQSAVTVCAAKAQQYTQKSVRSKHIGKNVVARNNARV